MAKDDRRSGLDRRAGQDRRCGVDTRSDEEKRLQGERRSNSDRRSIGPTVECRSPRLPQDLRSAEILGFPQIKTRERFRFRSRKKLGRKFIFAKL